MGFARCDTCGHCAKAIHKHQKTLASTSFHTTYQTHKRECFITLCLTSHNVFFHFVYSECNSRHSAHAFSPCFFVFHVDEWFNSFLFDTSLTLCHHRSFSNILSLQHITGTLQFALQMNVLFLPSFLK